MKKINKKDSKDESEDEFLQKVQQPKMKELWDNKEDRAWEKNIPKSLFGSLKGKIKRLTRKERNKMQQDEWRE